MALQKNTTINGFIANYYRIIRINFPVDGTAEVFLALYKDQATREANPNAIMDVKTFSFSIDRDKLINGNTFEYCYQQIIKSDKTPAIPAKDAVYDTDGVTILSPAQEAVSEGPEQNFFADAQFI